MNSVMNATFAGKPDYDEFTPDLAKVSGFLTDAELEEATALNDECGTMNDEFIIPSSPY